MKRSLAFTLVELLAVIVILAIILAIAVPSITGVINSSTRSAFLSDAKMVIKAIDYKLLEDDTYDVTSITEANIEGELGVADDNYQNLEVINQAGKTYITIIGKNKWDGLAACGTYKDIKLGTLEECVPFYSSSEGVNRPVLAAGMTAIKWDGTNWIEVENPNTDTTWYNYPNKEWANAKTSDGSMWVWIPRYVYKISSGWHTSTEGTIDISFSMGTDDTRGGTITLDTETTANASNNKWTNHPAFTFGDDEVTGIWVAKFEASNDGSNNIKVVPNATSWYTINQTDAFDKSRSMETTALYGWGTTGTGIDTHLIKNTEWGAVAYLSKSIYGKNTEEIWNNPAEDYTTGCAGDSVESTSTASCLRTYETVNGVKASSTGTIYGIYDLSGGSYEKVSAYIDNGNLDILSITNADNKYKDIYSVGEIDSGVNNYTLALNKKGDAVYETSGTLGESAAWFDDYTNMPSGNSIWFARGGSCIDGEPGVFGFATSGEGFRPIILVGAEL